MTNELARHLQHPNIFINAPEHSVYVLFQILLAEHFPNDFNDLDITLCYYHSAGKQLSIEESICCDWESITKTNGFNTCFQAEIIPKLYSYFSALNTINQNTIEYISKRYSFKVDFLKLIKRSIPDIDLLKFAEAMNKPAHTCIRVNSSIATNVVTQYFSSKEMDYCLGKISPACIALTKRYRLTTLDIYRNGWFAIQDEASQLVGYAVNPSANDNILDACAGAGGKSLHLADLQNDCGNIICSDISKRKLNEIKKRATLAKIQSISITNELADADIVLVDAPCTGSGTLRRDPMKKYMIAEKTIDKISEKQYEILCKYSEYVVSGGYLIYSTCSVLPQENELIVNKFLAEHNDFVADALLPQFTKHCVKLDIQSDAYHITLYPHIHRTDGFFIARMHRK